MTRRLFFKSYVFLAVCLLSVIYLLFILNFLSSVFFSLKDRAVFGVRGSTQKPGVFFNEDGSPVPNGKRTDYQLRWFDFNAMKEIDRQYASEVLDDFYELSSKGFIYQPWVQFSEPPFVGRRVNVVTDEKGFPMRRSVPVNKDPPTRVVRVFVMGGSSTFGYNVSDEHTWPSYLSEILNERTGPDGSKVAARVSNYGRGYYYSTQELIYLFQLLRSGHRPDLVIFMDGNNETERDTPHFTRETSKAFRAAQGFERAWFARSYFIPIIRLVKGINDRFLSLRDHEAKDPSGAAVLNQENIRRIKELSERIEQNRKLADFLCSMHGARSLFFLQPTPLYRYNLKLYRFPLPKTFMEKKMIKRVLYDFIRQDTGYIDLSNLFELWGADRKSIIDDVHYSPAFNRFLAERVASYIDLADLAKQVEIQQRS